MRIRWILASALMLLGPGWAEGRLFHLPASEEMEAGSTLVCNAVVESVTDTGQAEDQPMWHEKRMEAKLRLLHVFKGDAQGEVVILIGIWIRPGIRS